MTLTIDLTADQRAALEAEASLHGFSLPEFARLRLLENVSTETEKPKTGAELAARIRGLNLSGNYGDPGLDSPDLARKLRKEAESRR